MSGPSISVIILTFNEEANIREAIDSVRGWAKEVLVVDSLSTDATIDRIREIADPGVGVVQHPFESYSQQWNWALKGLPLTGDWTLKLDADERVTPGFKAELSGLLPELSQHVDGIYFRRRIQIVGGWIESRGSQEKLRHADVADRKSRVREPPDQRTRSGQGKDSSGEVVRGPL